MSRRTVCDHLSCKQPIVEAVAYRLEAQDPDNGRVISQSDFHAKCLVEYVKEELTGGSGESR